MGRSADGGVGSIEMSYLNKCMKTSELQKARAAYQPKLPVALQGGVKLVEGAPTTSVDNQEEIKQLFPNTYGMPLVEFAQAVRLLVDTTS